ncbi:MAG: hypothetical protein HQK67_13075 [Desulfamplus sp.]|nr:hypothetical protein [Desulfamplus sp.]
MRELKYEDLSDKQIWLVSNGCGGKGGVVKPPHKLFFESSCAMHDVSYSQGGCEEDRIEADVGFFRAMLKDCEKVSGVLSKRRYVIWAHLYFMGVRTFGWRYFNYRHEKLSLASLIKSMEGAT